MDVFDDKEIAKEEELDDDSDFRIFLEKQPIGIAVVHEGYRDIEGSVAQPDSGDFVKWVRANKPDINIDVPTYDKQLVLRSNDYWLPLVFLASDITLPIYLNLVANYLYDKSKGLLKGETQRVDLPPKKWTQG